MQWSYTLGLLLIAVSVGVSVVMVFASSSRALSSLEFTLFQ